MKRMRSRRQSGQSMVIIAMAMVALLIFAAFAVDLGYVFFQRRTTQNAADAAALAAARKMGLAFSDPAGQRLSVSDMQSVIEDYMLRNEGQVPTLSCVLGDGTRVDADGLTNVPSKAVGMEITVKNTFGPWFSRIMGYGSLSASSSACASFSGANDLTKIAPIAVSGAYMTAVGSGAVNLSTASAGDIGALALSCSDPSTGCVPGTSDLVAWTKNGYPGVVTLPVNMGGRLDISCWGEISLQPGRVLILPVYDVLEHHQYADCQGDPALTGCVADPATVTTVYDVVRDGVAVPYHVFHLNSFSAFQVGSAGWPNGRFVSHAVNGSGGNDVNKGAIVVKLTCPSPADPQPTPTKMKPKDCVKEGRVVYQAIYSGFRSSTDKKGNRGITFQYTIKTLCGHDVSHIDFAIDPTDKAGAPMNAGGYDYVNVVDTSDPTWTITSKDKDINAAFPSIGKVVKLDSGFEDDSDHEVWITVNVGKGATPSDYQYCMSPPEYVFIKASTAIYRAEFYGDNAQCSVWAGE